MHQVSRCSDAANQRHIAVRATRRLPARRENPEGGSPLWGGLGGTSPNPNPPHLPPRKGASSAAEHLGRQGRAHGHAPLRIRDRRRPGGRVQRGRSPLWWGNGGTPQPLSAPLPAREVGGRPELGRARRHAPLRQEGRRLRAGLEGGVAAVYGDGDSGDVVGGMAGQEDRDAR